MRDEEVCLGDWLVQPSLNRLVRDDTVHRLEPRVMGVLLCLMDRPGLVVTRSEILSQVWSGVVVEDIAVSQAISHIRKKLGDSARSPTYVETVPKRGYRLIAPVKQRDSRFAGLSNGAIRGPALSGKQPAKDASVHSRRGRLRGAIPLSRSSGSTIGSILLIVGGLVGVVVLATAVRMVPGRSPATTETEPEWSSQRSFVTPVTVSPDLKIDPALSPDGQQVAYATRWENGKMLNLFISASAGGEALRLTDSDSDDVYPAWSPDGSTIAFVRQVGGACRYMLLAYPGGEERQLGECEEESHPQLNWWLSGDALVISHRPTPDDPYRLSSLSIENGTLTQLTFPPPDALGDRYPSSSANEPTVAFARMRRNGTGSVLAMNVNTGEERWLSDVQEQIYGVSWSAHDGDIYYSARADGNRSLWRTSARGRTTERIKLRGAFSPSTARDVGTLAFAQYSLKSALWTASLDGHEHRRREVVSQGPWVASPQISPDGTELAYISPVDSYPELWVSLVDGTNARPITRFASSVIDRLRWSPDGQSIAFDVQIEGGSAVYRADLRSSRVERLTTYGSDNIAPTWSRNGKWIYFGSNRTGQWHVWKIPSQGGDANLLIQAESTMAQEGPQGELYFTHSSRSGIRRYDIASGTSSVVAKAPYLEDWWNWTAGESGLYFLQNGPLPRVQMLAYGDEEVTLVAELPGAARTPALVTTSADGLQTIYARSTRLDSQVMLYSGGTNGDRMAAEAHKAAIVKISNPSQE